MKMIFLLLFLILSCIDSFSQGLCDYKVIPLNKFEDSATFHIRAYTVINIPISDFDRVRKKNVLFKSGYAVRGDLLGLENNFVPFCRIKNHTLTEVKVEQDSVLKGFLNIRLIYSQIPKKK
jgi:hypothetical protein